MKVLINNIAHHLKSFHRGMRRSEVGMTLIEIMIVIALLGGLMAVLVTSFSGTAEKAKIDQTKLAFNSISQVLQMYKIHVGKYPTTDQGLNALITNPGDNKSWRGPYSEEKLMKDPWSNEIKYESDGRNFKLQSGGPDGSLGNDDDLFFPEQTKTEGQ